MRGIEMLPPEKALNVPRLICTGREEAVIEGHTGLFSYDTSRIRVRTKRGVWTVEGRDLTIDYFGAQDLLIHGSVDAVRMEENA